MEWNRVWAIGKSTYVRFYPNAGVGVALGKYRLALSLMGGIEWFQRKVDGTWRRTWKAYSRIPSRRNGGS